MAESSRLFAEPLRSLAFGAIGASYVSIGSALAFPAHLFLVQNLTDALLVFSLDGVNDHFVLPANGFFTSDVTTNRTNNIGEWYLAKGQRIYVKRVGIPTAGSVYLSAFHGSV